jgi:hypothetical protein
MKQWVLRQESQKVRVFSGALWRREQREQAMKMVLTERSGTHSTRLTAYQTLAAAGEQGSRSTG